MTDYRFADRVIGLNPSAIREILKYAADPEVVSLSAGNPAPEAFPVKEIAEISNRILTTRPIDALQYSTTEGYTPLRRRLTAYMKDKHHVGREFDDILITAGAQQAMELLAKVLCNPGDVVLCEAPSFVGSLNSIRSLGGKLMGVPVQEDGIDVEALEQAAKENKVTFLYTIPNFQNPSGVTMSMEKRRRVYELAEQYDFLIVEDNPYGDLRFEGEPVPAIKSLDEDGRVAYVGSFSKVLAPGIRVGYAIAPKPLLQKMIVCKQGEDVHTAIWNQMICDEYMENYDFEAHLKDLQEIYRKKAKLMLSLIEEYLVPAGVTYQPVQGGLFVWCALPEGADMRTFCTQAVRDHKVAVVPGNAFLVEDDAPCQAFRINFSTPTDEDMKKGMERLGKFAREFLK
jgi:2-aminoadipate transaminase